MGFKIGYTMDKRFLDEIEKEHYLQVPIHSYRQQNQEIRRQIIASIASRRWRNIKNYILAFRINQNESTVNYNSSEVHTAGNRVCPLCRLQGKLFNLILIELNQYMT